MPDDCGETDCEELQAEKVKTNYQGLVLEVVAWYFDQRRYVVSKCSAGGYYAHDRNHRYSKLICMPDGSDAWPSVYMALCAARAKGEDSPDD